MATRTFNFDVVSLEIGDQTPFGKVLGLSKFKSGSTNYVRIGLDTSSCHINIAEGGNLEVTREIKLICPKGKLEVNPIRYDLSVGGRDLCEFSCEEQRIF